jgi:hypothetical protein
MKDIDRLNRLRIASPCPTAWEQMAGNNRVRLCDLCNLHVYKIGQMTRQDAEALISNTEGRICARPYRRTDGTIIYQRLSGRSARDSAAGGEGRGRRVRDADAPVCDCRWTKAEEQIFLPGASEDYWRDFKGRDRDRRSLGKNCRSNGPTVPGAKISIIDQKTTKSHDTQSNSAGRFAVAGLTSGAYDIAIESPGFKRLELKKFTLAAKETVSFDPILTFDATTVTVGILIDTPSIDTCTPGTIIIPGEMLRKLHINN